MHTLVVLGILKTFFGTSTVAHPIRVVESCCKSFYGTISFELPDHCCTQLTCACTTFPDNNNNNNNNGGRGGNNNNNNNNNGGNGGANNNNSEFLLSFSALVILEEHTTIEAHAVITKPHECINSAWYSCAVCRSSALVCSYLIKHVTARSTAFLW